VIQDSITHTQQSLLERTPTCLVVNNINMLEMAHTDLRVMPTKEWKMDNINMVQRNPTCLKLEVHHQT
jgi:hypothetical protein